MALSITGSYNGNDDGELKIIANILQYLSAEELRESRLVSQRFNEVICSHPKLFWAKNTFVIDIPPSQEEEAQWIAVRLNKLVTEYDCPNFHFHRVNLLSKKSIEFFQSSVRQQIRELKLTNCTFSYEILRNILAYTARALESLEITDFSDVQVDTAEETRKNIIPFMKNLASVVLISQLSLRDNLNVHIANLPSSLLRHIFNGGQKLERICLLGWNSKTCLTLLRILRLLSPSKTTDINCLEIICIVEEGLSAEEQFSFMKSLQLIQLPALKKLSIRFTRPAIVVHDLSKQFIKELTHSVATFLQNNRHNLETLDLTNCPIYNSVLEPNIISFRSLYHVNTRGTFVTELNDNESEDEEDSDLDRNAYLYSKRNYRDSISNPDGSRTTRISQFLSSSDRTQQTLQHQHEQPQTDLFSRLEVYQIACCFVICVVVIHMGLKYMIPSSPNIREQLEVLIFASIVMCLTKGSEIKKLWNSDYSTVNF